jgi:hypothetical protein
VQDTLTAWYSDIFGAAPEPVIGNTLSEPTTSATADDVIAALTKQGAAKVQRLLSGDSSGYKSPSEARYALGNMALAHTRDLDVIIGLLVRSGLFDHKDAPGERIRKAGYDAQKLIAQPAARVDGQLHRDARAILANKALGPARLTAYVLVLDLADRLARGERPDEHGFLIPAARYAEQSAQTERTVLNHIKVLVGRGLLAKRKERRVTNHTVAYDTVDGTTGEITSHTERVRGTRDHNSLMLPEGGLSALIHQLITAGEASGSDAPPTGHIEDVMSPAGAIERTSTTLVEPHPAAIKLTWFGCKRFTPHNTVYARKFLHPKVGGQETHPNRSWGAGSK